MATDWANGYSECHYHSNNHFISIGALLFEISLVQHEDKQSEICGIFVIISVKSNKSTIKYSKTRH